MSRIEGLQDKDAGFIARRIFKAAGKMRGAVPEPLRLMARNSGVMWAAVGFELGIGRAKSLDEKIKSLASLKAASMVGCLF
jgi:hypothetical protein